jgi:hypothetical protein
MKIPLVLTTLLALALHASAFEKREFRNADKSKSFHAVAIGYDAETDTVTVRKTAGETLRFKLSLLCEEDRKYVREHGDAFAAAAGLRIDFDLFEGEKQTTRGGVERTTTTPAGYSITVENRGPKDFENVEVDYVIFHRKDAEDGPGSIVQSSGTISFATLFSNYRLTEQTDTIDLVRYSRRKEGGGG